MKWHRAACGEPLPRCGKDWFRGLPKRDSRRNGAIERATHRDEKSVCKCPVQAHGSESCTAAATDSDEPLVQRSGGLFRTSHLNHGQKIGNKRRGQRQISIGIHRDGHGFQVTFCQAKEGMQSTLRFIGHRNDTSHDLSKLRFSAPVQELENMRRILATARESINQLDQTGRMRSTPFISASCLSFHFPTTLERTGSLVVLCSRVVVVGYRRRRPSRLHLVHFCSSLHQFHAKRFEFMGRWPMGTLARQLHTAMGLPTQVGCIGRKLRPNGGWQHRIADRSARLSLLGPHSFR